VSLNNATSFLLSGIDAENLGAIFEEHVVLNHLDPFNPVSSSFGLKERVFNFGTVMANLPDAATLAAGLATTGGTASKGSKGGKKDKSDTLPTSGTAVGEQAAVGNAAKMDAAVRASLKFINPCKVPCTVNFSIKPHSAVPAGECRVL
jgi:hydrocephalus-inducing protein